MVQTTSASRAPGGACARQLDREALSTCCLGPFFTVAVLLRAAAAEIGKRRRDPHKPDYLDHIRTLVAQAAGASHIEAHATCYSIGSL